MYWPNLSDTDRMWHKVNLKLNWFEFKDFFLIDWLPFQG